MSEYPYKWARVSIRISGWVRVAEHIREVAVRVPRGPQRRKRRHALRPRALAAAEQCGRAVRGGGVEVAVGGEEGRQLGTGTVEPNGHLHMERGRGV